MGIISQTLPEQIYGLVRDRIIRAEIEADSALRQDALAADLGVSKIPLREAFVRLEHDGLLLAKANRGYFISPMSLNEAMELYDLRLRLEPVAIAMSARSSSEAEREVVQATYDALKSTKNRSDFDAVRLNSAFHMSLLQNEKSPLTRQILERLVFISERYILAHLDHKTQTVGAEVDHLELLSAWMSRESELCAKLCYVHLAKTRDALKKSMTTEV